MGTELDAINKALNKEVDKIKKKTVAGSMALGLMIQREAMLLVPVHLGELRNSAYTQKSPDNPTVIEVGFSAVYAMAIHENLEAKLKGQPRPDGIGVYWGPDGEPQFLLKAVQKVMPNAPAVYAEYAKVGGES